MNRGCCSCRIRDMEGEDTTSKNREMHPAPHNGPPSQGLGSINHQRAKLTQSQERCLQSSRSVRRFLPADYTSLLPPHAIVCRGLKHHDVHWLAVIVTALTQKNRLALLYSTNPDMRKLHQLPDTLTIISSRHMADELTSRSFKLLQLILHCTRRNSRPQGRAAVCRHRPNPMG